MGLATYLHGTAHPPSTLRGIQFLAFDETAFVLRGSVTADSGGGGTMTWATAGTFACRVASMGGSPKLVAGRLDESSTHLILGAENVDVGTDDRLAVKNRAGTFGITNIGDSGDRRDTRIEAIIL